MPHRPNLTRPSSVALLALAAACSAPDPTVPDAGDAAADATLDVAADTGDIDVVEQMCPTLPAYATGSRDGHPDPLRSTATQARAGRLAAAALPRDPTGLATWAAGDFVLANDRVAVIIEDAGPSALYDPWGGKPVGLARVRDGALVAAADFNEAIFGLGRFVLETQSVTVTRDGAMGGNAAVRAAGVMRAVPFIDEFGRAVAPESYAGVRVALDYELAPAADHVDVYATIESTSVRPRAVPRVLHAFFQRYRLPMFTPNVGFVGSMSNLPATPWVGFAADGATGYAWIAPDGDLTPFISVSGFDSFVAPQFVLPPCAQTRRHFARIVVGSGPSLDGVVQSVARVRNTMLRAVTGTVTDASGAAVAGARVHATTMDGRTYLTRAVTDAMGAFTVHVPAGQPARLTAVRTADAPSPAVDVAATATTATLRLGAVGAIRVRASEMGRAGGLPVRVQVTPATGAPPAIPAVFGEDTPGRDRLHNAFVTTGDATLTAPPGRYRVVVSRGYEYEILNQEVTVTAGMTADVNATLRRVVDTTGIQCGDFHIHTHRSPDASDVARDKVASGVADGVEVLVRSEHEFIADFEPIIADLGVQQWAFGVGSLELTTFTWGHFGVVPLTPDPMAPNGGAPFWPGRLPPAVFDEVRARASQPTVIINHPRSGGRSGAYFEAAGFDPATGTAMRPEYWDTRFTAVEVFNESDVESNRDGTVRDWFSLLNHGRRVFAIGSSDSHRVLPDAPLGYPRTCMFLGTDNPRELTPGRVRDAAAQGRSTISGGIYVTAQTTGGQGPGQDAMGVGDRATVRVVVQAASWVPVRDLEVIVNGMTQERRMIDPAMADPMNPVVRFRGDIQVPVSAAGSWVVIAVHGGGDLSPVHPGKRSFGVTNPIFLRR